MGLFLLDSRDDRTVSISILVDYLLLSHHHRFMLVHCISSMGELIDHFENLSIRCFLTLALVCCRFGLPLALFRSFILILLLECFYWV